VREVPSDMGSKRRGQRQPVTMTLDDLRAFEALVRVHYPALRIEFKEQSFGQKLLGYLVFPFNHQYMTRYSSTFAPVVYFPSKDYYESNPKSSFTVLAHEFVHLLDTQQQPFWFRFTYMFPQTLAPLALAVYVAWARSHSWPLAVLLLGFVGSALIARVSMAAFFVAGLSVLLGSIALSIWASGWAFLAFLVGLLLLSPWPSPGRVYWERRGYAMSLGIYRWTFGGVPQILRAAVAKAFTGPSYYFMSWSKDGTLTWVNDTVEAASAGGLVKELPYGIVNDFLRSRNLVR